MRASDLLTRLAGVLMLVTSAWNVVMAILWFLSLFWALIGILWLIPMVLALLNLIFAIFTIVGGHHRFSVAGPLVGLFVSLCNFNFLAMFLDLLVLGLVIAGYVARSSEDREFGLR